MKVLPVRRARFVLFLELELLRTEALLLKKVPSVVHILAEIPLTQDWLPFSLGSYAPI